MKLSTRGARSPRKYKKFRSVTICDDNGVRIARISISNQGITLEHLKGYNFYAHETNGLGQMTLDNEPEKPFRCPHCGGHRMVYERPWVVCGECGQDVVHCPGKANCKIAQDADSHYTDPCFYCDARSQGVA